MPKPSRLRSIDPTPAPQLDAGDACARRRGVTTAKGMRTTSRTIVATLGITGALTIAGPRIAWAAAPAKTSALSWIRMPGAESCLSARELARGVERKLGRSIFVSAALADLSIEGRIERTASSPGYDVKLALSDDVGATLGTRELRGDQADCRALDEQLILVVAVMLDPDAALRPPLEDEPPAAPAGIPAPAPPAPVAREALAPAPRPLAAPSPRRRSWQAGMQLGASAGFGLLPSVSMNVELRGHLVSPWRWSLDLGASGWIPRRLDEGSRSGTFSLAYAFLSLCPPGLVTTIIRLRGCAGVQVGAIRGSGSGYALDQVSERPIVNVALEARLSRRLYGPLIGELGLALLVPLRRDQFVSRETLGSSTVITPIFRMSAVAGSVGAGLGFELP